MKINSDYKGEESRDVAEILNNIGAVYDSMGNYLLALDYCKRSLKI